MEIPLNPGFLPILAAFAVLAAPRAFRAPLMASAALAAIWLLLDYQFGAAAAIAHMGLSVVLLNLDALNRIFGIALLIALVAIAIYSGARRNRYEDAAILMLVGGSVSALFVGDLIIFVATASLAGLAASWTVFASTIENANRAGVRLLIWHGLEGLLFLVGVALHITAGAARVEIGRLDVDTIAGACIFAALMIRVGAPFAHVWLKDVVSHASPVGGAALSAFTTMLGVYALARLFPAEPLLVPIGAGMIVVGAFYAAAETDLRRAGAYALTAQTGVCVALIGVGSPLALAAAEGHAFAAVLAFVALQMVFGAVLERRGSVDVASLQGLSRQMPITALLALVAGLAVAGVPGFALYATQAVALEAVAQWDLRWLWLCVAATPAVLFVSLALRPALAAFRASVPTPIVEAPFPMMLGAALASFLCVAIGLAPGWLYDLMPTALTFQPFAIDRVAQQFELLGVAGLIYLALHAVGAAPKARQIRTLDIDALYRGPFADAGRWAGVLLLRVYGAWQGAANQAGAATARIVGAMAQLCDRPFAPARAANVVQFFTIGAILMMILLFV